MVNPYAAPSSVSTIIQPIRFGFGQILTLDDHLISLRDTPPQKGLARFQLPLIACLIMGAAWPLASEFESYAEPLPAFAWMLIGIGLCPFWIWLIGRFSPQRRKRLARVRTAAENAKPTFGVISEDFFFDTDRDTTVRCQWSHFSRAYVFPEHLLLPVAVDANRRVVIPWRLFASPADVRQVCKFVVDRLGVIVNQPPTDQQLATLFESLDSDDQASDVSWPVDRWPVDDPTLLSDDHWPNSLGDEPSTGEEQFDSQIDLRASLSLWQFTGLSSLLIVAYLIWVFLPFWAATAGWLTANYWFFGDWTFLVKRPWSTAFALIPGVALAWIFLQAAIGSLVQRRHQQSKPMLIRLRPSGLHLAGATFESWLSLTSISRWIVDDMNAVGWTLKETGEDVRIPAKCFSDRTEMERLKQQIREFFPSIA